MALSIPAHNRKIINHSGGFVVINSKNMNEPSVNQNFILGNIEKNSDALEASPKILRAVSYVRVSSEEQKKKKLSIHELQIPECKKLIEDMGWKFVKNYADEGFGGNTFMKRTHLQEMLAEDIDTYDVVVLWSFDRLVRDDSETEAKIYKILDINQKQATSVLQRVEIVNPNEYDPKSLNVATQRRFRGIQVAYDSLVRRERFMASRQKTVKKGKHIVTASYGYEIIREIDPMNPKRTIGFRIPNKKEAIVLKRIFRERVLDGKSLMQIARELNKDGIRTRSGTEWSRSRIYQVLVNPFPSGYILWNKSKERKHGDDRIREVIPESKWQFIPVNEKIEKYYKPLISQDVYLRARRIRKENYKSGGRGLSSSNILTSIVKCPICGSSMVETAFYWLKKPPYKKGYFICSKYHNKNLCSKQAYPGYPMKQSVTRKVKAFLNDPQIFKEYLEKKTDKNNLKEKETKLRFLERQVRQTQKRIEILNLKYLDGKIKEEYYIELLPTLEAEEVQQKKKIPELEKQLNNGSQRPQDQQSLKNLSKLIKDKFNDLSPQQLKLIIRTLVKEVKPNIKADPKTIYYPPAIMEHRCAYPK